MGIIRILLIALVAALLFTWVTTRAQSQNQAHEFGPVLSPSVDNAISPNEITGALIFYTSGGITVPYIFYETNGVPATRSLTFAADSDCGSPSCNNFSGAYTDTQVQIGGDVTSAHILVRQLVAAINPDSRITLVQGALGDTIPIASDFAITPNTYVENGDGLTLQAEVAGAIAGSYFFREGTIVSVGKYHVSLAEAVNGRFVFAIEN